jgi:hypothetical protein
MYLKIGLKCHAFLTLSLDEGESGKYSSAESLSHKYCLQFPSWGPVEWSPGLKQAPSTPQSDTSGSHLGWTGSVYDKWLLSCALSQTSSWCFSQQQPGLDVDGPEFDPEPTNTKFYAIFQVPTVVSMKMTLLWVVMPCSLVEVYQHLRGACCKTAIYKILC